MGLVGTIFWQCSDHFQPVPDPGPSRAFAALSCVFSRQWCVAQLSFFGFVPVFYPVVA